MLEGGEEPTRLEEGVRFKRRAGAVGPCGKVGRRELVRSDDPGSHGTHDTFIGITGGVLKVPYDIGSGTERPPGVLLGHRCLDVRPPLANEGPPLAHGDSVDECVEATLLPLGGRVHHAGMGRVGRFVMVVWAAGGNVAPSAGLAMVLSGRGHQVHVLGSPVLQKRFEAAGCTFTPFSRAREAGPVEVDVFDDNLLGWNRFISGTRLADDVSAELEHETPDAVIVDCALSAALFAAEKKGVPTATLVHVLYAASVEGPGATQWDAIRPLVDTTRKHLELAALDPELPVLPATWDRSDLVIACTPEPFDVPLGARAANLRYVGPIFEQTPGVANRSDDPLVLVSFSTTNMRQGRVLQRVLDALEPLPLQVLCTLGGVSVGELHPPANATVREWVPLMEVLSRASAVVTHAGLSTVMSSLASGVPLVCMPLGRDQPWNAERVVALGLGRHISEGSSVGTISEAVEDILDDGRFMLEAQRMAEVIADYGNGAKAVSELEALL